ncbi:hypothetical protein GCM10010234_64980 [Streptomyces hawaiiensis]
MATTMCSHRLYVTARINGRSMRTMAPSCQRPPATGLPRTGETISTTGGGPHPGPTATLLL